MPYKKLFTKISLLLSTPIAAMLVCSLGGAPARAASSLCGTVPYKSNTGYHHAKSNYRLSEVWSFVSEPNLHPMKVTVNTYRPWYIFRIYISRPICIFRQCDIWATGIIDTG